MITQIGKEGERESLPVDASLPSSITKAVPEVKEHGAKVLAAFGPVNLDSLPILAGNDGTLGLILLPGVTAAPGDKGEDDEHDKGDLGADAAPQAGVVEGEAKDDGANDLRKPVEETVESARAEVEVGGVETVVLVGVEDVGGEEHGEEQEDPGLLDKGFKKALELGLPGRVLHENDLAAIIADDLVGVAQAQTANEANGHEGNQSSVGTVGGALGFLVVYALAEECL